VPEYTRQRCQLIGGAGDDLLWGSAGDDRVDGGAGTDKPRVDRGRDVVRAVERFF
jgi:Ca2+-binding RTX toxin-like protein